MGTANKQILVTGGGGYIGSHTILELLNEDYDVVAIDSCINSVLGENSKPISIERVEKFCGKKVDFYHLCLSNKEGLRNVFKNHKIDVVIHFAALKAVGESINQPLTYYSNNINGTITILEVMQEFGVYNFLFSSSATVYGTPQYLPMDEEHPTGINLTNPYGQTKYMSEQILKDLTKADKRWKVLILRYFNPVGAHKSGLIGEDPKGIPNNLMPFLSQVAVGTREKLNIFGNDYDTHDGTGVRDYIHVVDLALGHVTALKYMMKKENIIQWKPFNLGTGNGVSVLDMVKSFSKACGHSIAYEIVDRREGDLATVVASCSLAMEEMGWKARLSLDDMCEDTWRWQKMNPNGYAGPKS